MTVTLPDVSEFQSPASGNAPNWPGIKSQSGGAAIIRVGYGDATPAAKARPRTGCG